MKTVIVIGCGISGLATALELVARNFDVVIYADRLPPHTTSDRAAAFWSPYYAGGHRVVQWAQVSYRHYERLAADPRCGVRMTRLRRFGKNDSRACPDWAAALPEGRAKSLPASALPPGYDEGYELLVPIIETHIFLPHLMNRFTAAGGRIVRRRVSGLNALEAEADLLVNCTGLGALALTADDQMIPVKGQVVQLDLRPDVPILLDEQQPTYLVPRSDGLIVGGTREEGVFDEHTDEQTLTDILRRAERFLPQVATARRLGQWAGLRPYRSTVRVERCGRIIHNYGHGGSGFTLAWGCARDVAGLAGRNE